MQQHIAIALSSLWLTVLPAPLWAEAAGAAPQGEIAALIASAAEAGVPTGPLLAKYREGAAKGVPEARLLVVLRTLRTRLERAGAVLEDAVRQGAQRPVRSDDLVRVASALAAGVPETALRNLGAAAASHGTPVGRLAVAAATLERLRALGVYDEAAERALVRAIERGHRERDLMQIAEDYRHWADAGGSSAAFFRDMDQRAPGDGIAGTDLGQDAASAAARGRLPGEQAGAADSDVPGVREMAEDEERSDPYEGARPGAADSYPTDPPIDPDRPEPPRP